MLRVTSAGVLVVPPFECAWLSLEDALGPEEAARGACVAFECRAHNDVTVLLKRVGGGKRWQGRLAAAATAAATGGNAAAGAATTATATAAATGATTHEAGVEPNYTVILGSHRNTCLKFEKSGETVCSARGVPGATVGAARGGGGGGGRAADADDDANAAAAAAAATAAAPAQQFQRMWVNYDARAAAITVGAGEPGCGPCFTWTDGGGGGGAGGADGGGGGGAVGGNAAAAAAAAATATTPPTPPISGIRHVGLSCWDKHVGYRDVRVLPAFSARRLAAAQQQQQNAGAAAATDATAPAAATAPATPPPHRPHVQQDQQQQQLFGRFPWGALDHNGATTTITTTMATTRAAATATAPAPPPPPPPQAPPPVPSLFRLASLSLAARGLSPSTCCQALSVSELLLPAAAPLYRAAVEACAGGLPAVVRGWPGELAGLSEDALADVLLEPLLACPERCVLAAVCVWLGLPAPAGFGEEEEDFQEEEEEAGGAFPPPPEQQQQQPPPLLRSADEAARAVALVRFALMSSSEVEAARRLRQFALYPSARAVMEASLSGKASSSSSAGAALAAAEQQQQQQNQQQRPSHAGAAPPRDLLAVLHDRRRVRLALLAAPGSPDRAATTTATAAAALKEEDGGGQPLPPPPPPSSSSSSLLPPAPRPPGRRLQRLGPATRELMYVCDGDRNGVFAFLGTDYGRRPNTWVNPALGVGGGGGGAGAGAGAAGGGAAAGGGGAAGGAAVRVWASSPPGRHTNPPAILGGAFLRTSYAGPRHAPAGGGGAGAAGAGADAAAAAAAAGSANGNANGAAAAAPCPAAAAPPPPSPETWWAVDLGPHHRLLVNYYTLRHDGSSDGFARGWVLQGSSDLRAWRTLRSHSSDGALGLPGQYASWPVVGSAAARPFRAFRLLLTQPCAGGSWHFVLSQLELYGLLTVYPAAAAAAAAAG